MDKLMGDGQLAVFGAPEPMADHAVRALSAARELRGTLATINQEHHRAGKPGTGLGVGIHSGPVVAGCLGAGARLEFAVIGDTVNVASRLEALTKQQGVDILVSADTVAAAAALGLLFEPAGTLDIRGRNEPLVAYSLPASPAGSASGRSA